VLDGMSFFIIATPSQRDRSLADFENRLDNCEIIPKLLSDVKFAFRMLFRTPAFSFTAALVLALGLGATTAIFTLIEHLLLSPLPYPDGDRLVWLWSVPPRSGAGLRGLFATDIDEIRRESRVFESIGGAFPGSWNVTGVGEPVRLAGTRVTSDFFPTLGIQPQIGRLFLPEEYRVGHEMVAIFSHSFWENRLGADPNIVGRRISMDGISFEIVGVMPREFALSAEYDLWAPLPPASPYATGRTWRQVRACGRLKPGVTPQQAQAEMNAIAASLASRYPEDRGFGLKLVTFLDQEVGSVRHTLWVFAAAVGCVLLIACANVASLLLARGAARVREMAVRAAVGASRGELIRQLLIESGFLAVAGAALGLPLAVFGIKLLIALDANALPRASEIRIDARVVAFSFFLSLATALIFGIVPALRGSRVGLRGALTEGGRGGSGGRSGNRLRSTLVVAEVALGVVLLASAGLLARSFRQLMEIRPGYDISSVVTMQVVLSDVRYREMAQCEKFFEQVLTQLEQIPGIDSAGTTNYIPLMPVKQTAGIWLDSQPVHSNDTKIVLDNRVVSPGYFRAMGVPLLSGRFFEWSDRIDSAKVTIVNEAFVRQFFPRGDVLGKRVTIDLVSSKWTGEIVGVVGSFREAELAQEPRPELFTPYAQTTVPANRLVVRSADVLNAVRGAIATVDPDVGFYNVRTMKQQVSDSLAQPRLRSALLAVFSMVALILASLGVYGVIACSVAERKREIGIRIALGARPFEVRSMVLAQGLKLTTIGLALGLVGAAAATRLIEGFLFGVSAADPFTYAATCAVFLAVALLASYLPARRAMRVDPITALREE
jgi:putative ABC transport system permease protein